MYYKLITIFILALTSCHSPKGKETYKFHQQSETAFSPLINKKTISQRLNKDTQVYNDDYPVYFYLYEDFTFYYVLPGIGEDEGTWEIENGMIKLIGQTILFDLIVYIENTSDNAFTFKFRDRNGPQVIPLSIK